MAKNLVIVESPAKAKTIEKFLGKDYKVASSFGHISDLPSNELGVAVEDQFKPKYIVSADKKKIVKELKSLAKKAETVWLASDEDREGEAIAWHLYEQLQLEKDATKRIVFHEITKSAIVNALAHPRDLDYNLVNAQQARRVLDRLVGYELSPLLWRKVKGGLSAGRVQSVAVRLIVEREREIQSFIPEQSFKTQAQFTTANGKIIPAQLQESFPSAAAAEEYLEQQKGATFQVAAIEKKPAKKSPAPPFTTSTLQQEAARKLYFSVSRTMNLAQRLYENGYITYMRTDSVNLSKEAQKAAAEAIGDRYGANYVNTKNFKTKNKSAQEAHEAIRPTNLAADQVPVEADQLRLYQLIWKRTIASQMSDAKLERTKVSIQSSTHPAPFVAQGEVVLFDGFLKVYLEGTDDDENETKGILPALAKGEALAVQSLTSTQKFTRPPYRYSEASLVKKLEELGIGRPSTYAPTISTVQNRSYIKKGTEEGKAREYLRLQLDANKIIKKEKATEMVGSEKGKLVPTDIGTIVNDFLVANFESILDYSFTANVEKSFDAIALGEKNWTSMMEGFYSQFHETVDYVKENAQRESGERILGEHPETGRVVKVRLGKFGPLAQIGEPDDEDKPIFASLHPQQQLDTITMDEALALFELPKDLGEYDGEDLSVNNGRYGPYLRFGKKFISLPKGEDPNTLSRDRAIELVEEKKAADAPIAFYEEQPVTKGVGRFGPFIKWNGMFINVNKQYNFDALSEADIKTLIEAKIQKEKEKLVHDWAEEGIRVEKARWGRSVIIKGKQKVELSKDIDPTKITLEEAKTRLEQQKPAKRKKARAKK